MMDAAIYKAGFVLHLTGALRRDLCAAVADLNFDNADHGESLEIIFAASDDLRLVEAAAARLARKLIALSHHAPRPDAPAVFL